MLFIPISLQKYHHHYSNLMKERRYVSDAFEEARDNGDAETASLERKLKHICDSIDCYIENEYSAAVFEHYSERKPEIIRNSDGNRVEWEAAFGKEFEQVPKTLRHSLVGLIEGFGRYKI